MSIPLLKALTKHYTLVDKAAKSPGIAIPSELDYMPGPQDDLESMIWVLTYAILLHHQETLHGSDKADYKRDVVDQFYGGLSYSGLAKERKFMVYESCNSLSDEPEEWIPDPTQCKWFRRAMTLVDGYIRASPDGSTRAITFDTFDALCDEFITDE